MPQGTSQGTKLKRPDAKAKRAAAAAARISGRIWDSSRSRRFRVAPSFRFKRALRAAFDFAPPNWLYDLALGSNTMRTIAQTIFFHHRGLFSLDAWRDILTAQ